MTIRRPISLPQTSGDEARPGERDDAAATRLAPPAASAAARPWTVRRTPPATSVETEIVADTRYAISWLGAGGRVEESARMGPSSALFTNAFASLARGALIQTPSGPVAVEDLVPGDPVVTMRGIRTLLWKGSRIVAPQHRSLPLYRIAAEALGPGRPMPDLLLGPAARIVSRRTALRRLIGAEAALMPIGALADGEAVVQVRPVSAVQVFHLAFRSHTTFAANGVEVESVHPGTIDPAIGPQMRARFMAMFPHLDESESFGALALQRLNGEILERIMRIV